MRDRGGFFSSCSAMALGLILPARVGSALAEGYPQNAGWPREWHPSWACPLVLDFDGDGFRDLVLGTGLEPRLGAWDHRGQPLEGWPMRLKAEYGYPVAGGDVNNDGRLEVVFDELGGGGVRALGCDKKDIPGEWPRLLRWPHYSSVTLTDIDGDGNLDIVVPTATYELGVDQSEVHLLDHRGIPRRGWPVCVDEDVDAPASVGDIDLDGDSEVIFGTNYGVGDGRLRVCHHDGTLYRGEPLAEIGNKIVYGPTCLADIYGDRHPELVVMDHDIGATYAYDWTGRVIPGWPALYDAGLGISMPVGFAVPVKKGANTHSPVPPAVFGLFYRTEVPVWRDYALWIRLNRREGSGSWPVAKMNGTRLEGGGATAESPGRWLWYNAGHRDLKPGIHELDIEVVGTDIELDRWLLTTHKVFPLMAERPHAW